MDFDFVGNFLVSKEMDQAYPKINSYARQTVISSKKNPSNLKKMHKNELIYTVHLSKYRDLDNFNEFLSFPSRMSAVFDDSTRLSSLSTYKYVS